MTIEQAREWLQRHADNTPMPGAREAYRTILEELERTRWIPVEERLPKKQSWYHVVILDTKTKRKKVKQDLFAVELAKKYGHNVGFCKDGRQEGRERVIMWMPLPEPPGGGIMDGLIKFPTIYMDDETAVNIVKHSLTYLEGDGLTFEYMTYAIERVAMIDLTHWELSNEELQRALRWLFDHYDFK